MSMVIGLVGRVCPEGRKSRQDVSHSEEHIAEAAEVGVACKEEQEAGYVVLPASLLGLAAEAEEQSHIETQWSPEESRSREKAMVQDLLVEAEEE